jgi:hypothetical protein
MTKKFQRAKVFVDRSVQGALVRRLLLQWFMFFTIAVIVMPFWELILSGDLTTPSMVAMKESWKHTAPMFVFLLALLPAFAWDTVKLSNRFAGPIYRIRQVIRSAAAGEKVQPIKLRHGDFWQDVADDVNTLFEQLPSQRQGETAESQGLADSTPISADDDLAKVDEALNAINKSLNSARVEH